MTVYRWFIPEVEDPSDITDQERNFASARRLGDEVPLPGIPLHLGVGMQLGVGMSSLGEVTGEGAPGGACDDFCERR